MSHREVMEFMMIFDVVFWIAMIIVVLAEAYDDTKQRPFRGVK